MATLHRIATAVGARLEVRISWNGEALDRLLDAGHAALVEQTVRRLVASGWLCAVEVSFNIRGERGSIDVLAFHPGTRNALIVEVKSVIPDVQATLMTLDRKVRLAREIAAERGWDANHVGRLLVVGESRTSRRRVEAHQALFATALPARAVAIRSWLRAPGRPPDLAGLLFLSTGLPPAARHRMAPESQPSSRRSRTSRERVREAASSSAPREAG